MSGQFNFLKKYIYSCRMYKINNFFITISNQIGFNICFGNGGGWRSLALATTIGFK